MMNKKILAIIGVVVAGFVAFYFWYNGDEKVLVRKTDRVIECFEKDAGDGMMSGGMSAGAFRDLLAKSVQVNFQHKDVTDMSEAVSFKAEELAQKHLAFLKYAKSVEFSNKKVKVIEVTGETAKIEVSLDVKMDPKVEKLGNTVNAELGFIKQDDEWKLNKVLVK